MLLVTIATSPEARGEEKVASGGRSAYLLLTGEHLGSERKIILFSLDNRDTSSVSING